MLMFCLPFIQQKVLYVHLISITKCHNGIRIFKDNFCYGNICKEKAFAYFETKLFVKTGAIKSFLNLSIWSNVPCKELN